MITLIRNNVVKIVDCEERAEKLKAKGFKLSPCSSKPGNKQKEEVFHCPYCDKPYKTQDGLDKHIAKEHPNGGKDNGGYPATDNAGDNKQS